MPTVPLTPSAAHFTLSLHSHYKKKIPKKVIYISKGHAHVHLIKFPLVVVVQKSAFTLQKGLSSLHDNIQGNIMVNTEQIHSRLLDSS